MAKRNLSGLEAYEKEISKYRLLTIIALILGFYFAVASIIAIIVSNGNGAYNPGTGIIIFYVISAVILLIAGLIIIPRKLNKGLRIISLYKQTVAILNSYPDGNLSDLASHTGQSTAECIKNLEFMIDKNMFTDAFIDRGQQRLIINRTNTLNVEGNDPEDYTVCTCPGCGGQNRIKKGQSISCDFCGRTLQSSAPEQSSGIISKIQGELINQQVKNSRKTLYSKDPALYNKFKRYVTILNTYPDGDLDQLARDTGATKEETINNLEKMITYNWFRNAYIDRRLNRLVIVMDQVYDTTQNRVTVVCPNCGGINTIPEGAASQCNFCGSPIGS